MKKYEYLNDYCNDGKIINAIVPESNYLNKMGQEGWELCCVIERSNGGYKIFYWKREIIN
jgi:hypothetical protein